MYDDFLSLGERADVKFKSNKNKPPMIVVSREEGSKWYNYKIFNMRKFRAGDRFLIRADKRARPLRITSGGKALVKEYKPGRAVVYISNPCELIMGVKDHNRSKIIIDVTKPELPGIPGRILGVLLPDLMVPDNLIQDPLDRPFIALDTVLEHGGNHMSLCPVANWTQCEKANIYEKENGKYDLNRFSNDYRLAMKTLIWRAARAGAISHFYPFESIDTKHRYDYYRWLSYPWRSVNNNSYKSLPNGWINNLGTEFGYGGLDTPLHKIHLAFQAGKPEEARQWLAKYIRFMVSWVPEILQNYVAFIPILEGTSKTFETNQHLCYNGQVLGTNLSYLWRDSDIFKVNPDDIINKSRWQQFMSQLSFIQQHHNDRDRAKMFEWIKPFADYYDQGVIASTDGSKFGDGPTDKRRPHGSRPNEYDCAVVWKDGLRILINRFMGLVLKTLSWEDMCEHLQAVRNLISL